MNGQSYCNIKPSESISFIYCICLGLGHTLYFQCAENLNQHQNHQPIHSHSIELAGENMSICIDCSSNGKSPGTSEWNGRSVWHIFTEAWPEASHDICVRSSIHRAFPVYIDSPKYVFKYVYKHVLVQSYTHTHMHAYTCTNICIYVNKQADAHIGKRLKFLFDSLHTITVACVKNEYL